IVVNAVRQFKETTAIPAELAFKRLQTKSAEVSDGYNVQSLQSSFHDFSHAGNASHGERQEKRAYLVRLNHKESVRLAPVRGDLREKLVWRDSRRRSEVQFFSNLAPNHHCYTSGRGQTQLVLRHIEVGFVERKRLNQIRVPRKDFSHRA